MPRKTVQISSVSPYHISARCINREWFKLPIDEVWKIITDRLYFTSLCYNLKIYAFILMNNHFHLLTTTPEANVSAAMQYFIGETSKEIGRETGRINQVFGGRNHKTLIVSPHHFSHAYKYLYRNPVEAGIVTKVEDYKYSSLRGLLGYERLPVPIVEDSILFSDVNETLRWLNETPKPEHHKAIREALRRADFRLAKHNGYRDAHPLELLKY